MAEAATLFDLHALATVDDLLQNEDGPSLNASVDAALQSNFAERAVVEEQIVSYISRHTLLRAGDIIFTGTPEGRDSKLSQGQTGMAQGWATRSLAVWKNRAS